MNNLSTTLFFIRGTFNLHHWMQKKNTYCDICFAIILFLFMFSIWTRFILMQITHSCWLSILADISQLYTHLPCQCHGSPVTTICVISYRVVIIITTISFLLRKNLQTLYISIRIRDMKSSWLLNRQKFEIELK